MCRRSFLGKIRGRESGKGFSDGESTLALTADQEDSGPRRSEQDSQGPYCVGTTKVGNPWSVLALRKGVSPARRGHTIALSKS